MLTRRTLRYLDTLLANLPAVGLCLLAGTALKAATSTWNISGPPGPFTWQLDTNWNHTVIPNAIGDSALLSNDLTTAGMMAWSARPARTDRSASSR